MAMVLFPLNVYYFFAPSPTRMLPRLTMSDTEGSLLENRNCLTLREHMSSPKFFNFLILVFFVASGLPILDCHFGFL